MPKRALPVCTDEVPDDCQDCGACCHGGDRHVQVFGVDHELMCDVLGEDVAEACLRWDNNTAFLRMERGHCAQLEHRDGRYRCGIYEARPDACRALQRGTAACAAEREIRLRS